MNGRHIPLQSASLYDGREVFVWSDSLLDLGMDFLLVTWSLREMRCILQWHLIISMACILLRSSAVRVHDTQTYRKMDVTRECIRCILELREILLSFQTGFNLMNAAVVCAILESISGLVPSSVISEPR